MQRIKTALTIKYCAVQNYTILCNTIPTRYKFPLGKGRFDALATIVIASVMVTFAFEIVRRALEEVRPCVGAHFQYSFAPPSISSRFARFCRRRAAVSARPAPFQHARRAYELRTVCDEHLSKSLPTTSWRDCEIKTQQTMGVGACAASVDVAWCESQQPNLGAATQREASPSQVKTRQCG
jgi:hypothetical protein